MVNDLRQLLRVTAGRQEQPSAAIFDSCTLQSSPESGAWVGYDEARRRKGSKTHLAVDTPGHRLARLLTPVNEQDPEQVAELAQQVQDITDQSAEAAFVDQGYTENQPLEAAAPQGIRLEVIKLPQATRGLVLVSRRWVVERSFVWVTCFRCLAQDFACLPQTLARLSFLAFAILMLHPFIRLLVHCL